MLLVIQSFMTACSPKEEELFAPLPQETQNLPAVEEEEPASVDDIQPTTEVQTETELTPPTTEPTLLVNPLTGLEVSDPANLQRRPILVKVENLPRTNRPQYGLSYADIVYEYHTEEGTTRFAAVYYGQNVERIGPIRSGRMFDVELISMFKAVFVFGSAYQTVLEEYGRYDFADRLIVEGPNTEPALYRYEPAGRNLLMLDSNLLAEVNRFYEIDDTSQDLSGMQFSYELPESGVPADEIFVRFSSAIYNRWEYDPEAGQYLRFCDAENAYSISEEQYQALTDQLTGEQITADNLVILLAENFVAAPNIYDIDLQGEGRAFLARDGVLIDAQWVRSAPEDLLTLQTLEGQPLDFKPGQTWFEVLSDFANVKKNDNSWRFTFFMPE